MLAGVGQRVVRDERSDVPQLGGVRLQEFPARRHAIKNIRNAKGGSCRRSCRFYADKFAAGKFDARAFAFRFISGFEQQTRDRRDRWQSFAAEAQRGNRKQVVRGLELAGSVAFERQQRVVVGHPVAVIGHANHALPALLDLDANRLCARVERVFEQLFHHRRRPLDHFARRNFVRDGFRKYANARHQSVSPLAIFG